MVFADGATTLRLSGGAGAAAVHRRRRATWAIVLKPAGDRTELTLTYDVGGYAKGGLAETLAAPVDGVLGEQVARLKKLRRDRQAGLGALAPLRPPARG